MTRVLYIGGTGEVSYACVQEAARAGQQAAVFNRGNSAEPLPDGVEQITGDLTDDAGDAPPPEQDALIDRILAEHESLDA